MALGCHSGAYLWPSTDKAEAEDWRVHGQPGLHSNSLQQKKEGWLVSSWIVTETISALGVVGVCWLSLGQLRRSKSGASAIAEAVCPLSCRLHGAMCVQPPRFCVRHSVWPRVSPRERALGPVVVWLVSLQIPRIAAPPLQCDGLWS